MTAGDRGTTKIADRVVQRIATRAAAEPGDAGGVSRTVLGMSVGRGRAPRADVSVHGKIVTARVEMSVAYPSPVREVAHQVRERVRERIEALTGLTVRQVDVDVSVLEREAKVGTAQRPVAGARTRTPALSGASSTGAMS
ncbi:MULTISPECIES: Asp23/Gls24 family envelope stress response protein [Thermomonosporaceae]|uniref:Asp23/Gls24 family envelope stress response protein n=1 Tax=Thermomonosporaceae TaxID=2012 RepID=UPI00255AC8C6|nr:MULTISPECIES: Asp23/Gls24 family envelope stress response protein [Thermomonosporaceae]MDL4775635.1 Asp23/Gls24 family envelope stress response protein [Actinomadura xylanilytica]